jgi:hypothetical protein
MYPQERERIEEDILFLKKLDDDPMARNAEMEMCIRDPWHWLVRWVWTRDEHDRKHPFKRFPDKPYLKEITRIWREEKLLLVPKSRQMMITWLIVALYLHDTQFFPGRLNVFQSKKNADATAMVRRGKVIFDMQPWWMKQPVKFRESPQGELFFPEIDSRIMGIPQGADQLRMYTLSGLFIDEAAFQQKLEETWTAAKPTIDGEDCRVTMVSSANPSFFEMLVHDRVKSA